jgi:carotenoid cleavage dioxygenase
MPSENVFLTGPYAPYRLEGEAADLEVVGQIPTDLNGALFKVGPSPQFPLQDPQRYHWFDGDGMVHAMYLQQGRARYRNRYVETAELLAERQKGRGLYDSFVNGGKPMPLTTQIGFKIASKLGLKTDNHESPFKNPANTNVTVFDGRLLVFSEAGLPYELDPTTLRTVGQYDFHGSVSGPVTAHWKRDPDNGDLLFYGLENTTVSWHRANSAGEVLESHRVELGHSCIMHDYLVTPDFAVFLISATIGRVEQLLAGKPLLAWDPAAVGPRAKLAILTRGTGAVRYLELNDLFGITHYVNAFQRGRELVLDGFRVNRFGVRQEDLAEYPGKGTYNDWFTTMYATPWRWEVDLGSGKVFDCAMSNVQGEFPRINESRSGKEQRYAYYATTRRAGPWFTDGIAKLDYHSGVTLVQDMKGRLCSPGEPSFVPRQHAKSEDDGWVLSYWWDEQRDISELVIQDALDFLAEPVARVRLKHRVPGVGFHGNWVEASQIPGMLRN